MGDRSSLTAGQDVSTASLLDGQHNSGARGQFHFGALYRGTIVHVNPVSQTYTVVTESPRTTFENCYYATGLVGSLSGFNVSTILHLGTKVLITPSSPVSIVSVLPSDPPDHGNRGTRSATGIAGVGRDAVYSSLEWKDDAVHANQTHNADSQVGELEISNQMGVAIQLMTHFAKMAAGDRAKVETCVLNDMVRIVSDNFRHHSALGDFEIYNDGRLNYRVDGTSYPHESDGILDPKDPFAEVEDNQVVFDSVAETGRWRFSQFVGHLGDFIHLFITEPEEMLGNLAQDRAGHAKVWCGNDGSFLVQSVSDIVLERVIKVQVPIQHKKPLDPEGVKAEDYAELNTDPLAQWDFGFEFENAHEALFKLREYARWLGEYHSYARFIQMEEDGEWEVKSEAEAPNHAYTGKEADVEEANSGFEDQQYIERYATIRIFRDGSILNYDAWGSMVAMTKGDVQVAASRNLHMEAAGDIRIIAGQNIFMKARRSIEIVAVVGGLVLKARTWWKALCERGSMWLKSDAPDPTAGGYEEYVPDNPDEDPKAEVENYALLLDTEQGNIGAVSGRRMMLSATGLSEDEIPGTFESEEASMIIQSRGQDIRLQSLRNIHMTTTQGFNEDKPLEGIISMDTGVVSVSAHRDILFGCENFDINQNSFTFARSGNLLTVARAEVGDMKVKFSISAAAVTASSVRAGFVSAAAVGEGADPPDVPEPAMEYLVPERRDIRTAALATLSTRPSDTWIDSPQGPRWEFKTQGLQKGQAGLLYMSLAQQLLYEDELPAHMTETQHEWDWSVDDKLKSDAQRTGTDLPWPGKNARWHKPTDTLDNLHIPNEKKPADSFDLEGNDLQQATIKFQTRSNTNTE